MPEHHEGDLELLYRWLTVHEDAKNCRDEDDYRDIRGRIGDLMDETRGALAAEEATRGPSA